MATFLTSSIILINLLNPMLTLSQDDAANYGRYSRQLNRTLEFSKKNKPYSSDADKCGYYALKGGQTLRIQSSNFNKPTANQEQCQWRILGHRCTLKTSCPCFDVPYTEGDCSFDYLKISDSASFSHTFCGDVQPVGIYNSSSLVLTFSYRSDGRDPTNGFQCTVTCTAKGQRDPLPLRSSEVTCRGSNQNLLTSLFQ